LWWWWWLWWWLWWWCDGRPISVAPVAHKTTPTIVQHDIHGAVQPAARTMLVHHVRQCDEQIMHRGGPRKFEETVRVCG